MAAHTNEHEYGAHGHEDHGHTILPLWILRAVLVILVFFTLLTVGAGEAEKIFSEMFGVPIAPIVNVLIAMSIALVKALFVAAIFMQLRYDNPLNGMVLIFTVMTVAFFLLFTILDLGYRGTIDDVKAQYVIPGGSGYKIQQAERFDIGAANKPITEIAREAAQNPESPFHDEYLHYLHEQHETQLPTSSANQSRPQTDHQHPAYKHDTDAHQGDDAHADPSHDAGH